MFTAPVLLLNTGAEFIVFAALPSCCILKVKTAQRANANRLTSPLLSFDTNRLFFLSTLAMHRHLLFATAHRQSPTTTFTSQISQQLSISNRIPSLSTSTGFMCIFLRTAFVFCIYTLRQLGNLFRLAFAFYHKTFSSISVPFDSIPLCP